MLLINRVARMLRADFHSVLDRVEEPESLVRQSIREMEDAVVADEARCKRWNAELGNINSHAEDIAVRLATLDQELDVCFAADQSELAKSLVRKKLELQRLAEVVQRKKVSIESSLDDTRVQLQENQSRLEAMRQKADVLVNDSHQRCVDAAPGATELNVNQDDVDVAFLAEQQRRRQA
ncbi:MAG: PspA/IM30 family protein [Gammaproteobacteria bacterium]|nr:PspA/IM30 family protein [Gammaproteobacteria bacterium]